MKMIRLVSCEYNKAISYAWLIISRYAYNDSIWLCKQIESFQASWRLREDLHPRTVQGLQKLDPEIRCLASFGKRAYSREMDTQRMLLKDLLGGEYNRASPDRLLILARCTQFSAIRGS